jgi:hypothetical protein
MKTILDRLKEPSTYRGLTVIAAAAGIILSPALALAIGAVAVAVIGLIEVIRSEKKWPTSPTKPFKRRSSAKTAGICQRALQDILAGLFFLLLSCPSGFLIVLSVMEQHKEQLAELILDILMKQSFEHWHSNHFQDYITGEENAPTKAEILKELEWQVARELNLRWAVHLKLLHSYL